VNPEQRPGAGDPQSLVVEAVRESRRRNADVMNGVRLLLTTGFLGIYIYGINADEDPVLRRTWMYIAGYWVVAALIWYLARRLVSVRDTSRFAVPLLDMPMTMWIQCRNLELTEAPETIALFTLGIFLCLTAMSAFSLRIRHLLLTAVMATACLLIVYHEAGLSTTSRLSGPLLILITAGMLSWLPKRQSELIREGADRQARRNRLARYFSPGVAEVIERRDDPGEGESCEISVLFCDIRGFTRLSEDLEPCAVVRLLNDFHSHMVEEVFLYGGTLDKYLGDGLLAYFNAPVRQSDHCFRAVQCALAMKESLRRLNEERDAEGDEPLRMGIGVHAGEAIVGNIGASHRREFTAIGDTVNVASRLQDLTRKLERDILVSEAVVERILGASEKGLTFSPMGETEVRGRQRPLKLFVPGSTSTGRSETRVEPQPR